MSCSDDANKKTEDADYTIDVLTRCIVQKDEVGRKTIKIVRLKDAGEPAVVSVPLSQVKLLRLIWLVEKSDNEYYILVI